MTSWEVSVWPGHLSPCVWLTGPPISSFYKHGGTCAHSPGLLQLSEYLLHKFRAGTGLLGEEPAVRLVACITPHHPLLGGAAPSPRQATGRPKRAGSGELQMGVSVEAVHGLGTLTHCGRRAVSENRSTFILGKHSQKNTLHLETAFIVSHLF